MNSETSAERIFGYALFGTSGFATLIVIVGFWRMFT